jgi:hypothetical protein
MVEASISDALGVSSRASAASLVHPGSFHSHSRRRNEYQKRVEFICYEK